MKKILLSLALLASPLLAIAGISINIGEPDYYGQLQIGNERPPLLFAEPIIIEGRAGRYPPLYLRVPDFEARHWARFCYKYSACGRPVYFVNDNWYRNTYVPRYRHDHARPDYGRRYDRHDNGNHYGHDKRGHRDNRGGYPAERGVPADRGYPADRGVPADRGHPADRGVPAGNRGQHDKRLDKFYDAR